MRHHGFILTAGSAVRTLLLAVFISIPSVALASRVGGIKISIDDQKVLSASTFDNGTPPPAAVWRYLSSTELKPADGITIPVDESDPLKATLRGKISIDVRYGGSAEVSELRLVRGSLESGWLVAPEDVESIADSIGLRDIPVVLPSPAQDQIAEPEVKPASPWLWISIGAAIGAALASGLVVRQKRR